LVARTVEDATNEEQLATAIKTSMAAKQYGYEDLLAGLVARACKQVRYLCCPGYIFTWVGYAGERLLHKLGQHSCGETDGWHHC
jgi:hypothetical protein